MSFCRESYSPIEPLGPGKQFEKQALCNIAGICSHVMWIIVGTLLGQCDDNAYYKAIVETMLYKHDPDKWE